MNEICISLCNLSSIKLNFNEMTELSIQGWKKMFFSKSVEDVAENVASAFNVKPFAEVDVPSPALSLGIVKASGLSIVIVIFITLGEEKQNEGTSSNFIEKRLDDLNENDMKKLIFKTPVECEVFYFTYAKAVGFGVRRGAPRINRHGVVTSLRFCCDRKGVRSKKDKNCEDKKRKARDET
ncbi:hypothetical protein Cgig2_030884 [Carnegiea gigantea]|uniref:FAR1 domain-containing protein n=1 Tax=Carnegiea gigantea TaxID=171969 RepID=A0A9Q1QIU5_9CARY|nr:hypothetical protein Cgig2_030884 [Carnegiea gigantea]